MAYMWYICEKIFYNKNLDSAPQDDEFDTDKAGENASYNHGKYDVKNQANVR
jgi:hypothetical protein